MAAFGIDSGEDAGELCTVYSVRSLIPYLEDITVAAYYCNFVRQASRQIPHDASLATNHGAFHGPTEHNFTQLYPIATAADIQQYIITVKANGVTTYWCNYFQPGSHQCHFSGTRKQVIYHVRRVHINELKPFQCSWFVYHQP
jgi:hypothetical protein